MPSLNRRAFITRTSLGVAAVGALGAITGAMPALAQTPPTLPAPMPQAPTPPAPMTPAAVIAPGESFTVFVSDPTTGAGTILVGERAIPFSSATIVQAFRQAIG